MGPRRAAMARTPIASPATALVACRTCIRRRRTTARSSRSGPRTCSVSPGAAAGSGSRGGISGMQILSV